MEYQNTKIYKETLALLREIYAWTGESMVRILHRLVAAEHTRMKEKRHEAG